MFEKIVVGYAGDEAGRDALALAAVLANGAGGASSANGENGAGAAITVVFPYRPLLATRDAEEVEKEVRAEVAPLLAGLRDEPEPTYHWSSSSWPIGALHGLAAYEAADLIVFGANLQRALGCLPVSLMERMVHGAPCAVALAPAGYAACERQPPRRIGVGFCDSQEARAALGVACELAGKLGCELELIAGAGLDPMLASYAFSAPLLAQAESEIHAQTKEELERAAAKLRDGVALHTQTVGGIASEVLIERSKDLDLLVLGSRAYGPLRHALLGSVSAPVMREASCPVLVLPRGVRDPAHAPSERQSQTA